MSLLKNLKSKGAIDFSTPAQPPEIRPTISSSSASSESSIKGVTPAGLARNTVAQRHEVFRENEDLKLKLTEYESSKLVQALDPVRIKASKWANRHEASFACAEFDQLKEEIAAAGGNVQPIKVRPLLNSDPEDYEIVYGHRRHRACKDLGLAVNAIIDELTDQALFVEMDRENRNRSDLRPYEQGMMYAQALDSGLFPSARKMSEATGYHLGSMGKALLLARLPADVLSAFQSPLEIQYRWIDGLNGAVSSRPDEVKTVAKAIKEDNCVLSSKEVYERLISTGAGKDTNSSPQEVKISGSNGQAARIVSSPANNSISVNLKNIHPAKFAELENLVRKFLA